MSGPQLIPIGLGDLKATRDGDETLVCYGLGSCIGVVLTDPVGRVSGMAHVVLPDSSMARVRDVPGKYADTAVPALVTEMLQCGANRNRLRARLAGGARMFSIGGAVPRLDVGSRNVEAVVQALDHLRIPVLAADTGGSHGRTVTLQVSTGRVTVSTVGQGERLL